LRVTIVDETLSVSEAAHRVLSSMGLKTAVTKWLTELPFVI